MTFLGATLPQEESHSGTGLSRDIPIIENVYRGHVARSFASQIDSNGPRGDKTHKFAQMQAQRGYGNEEC